MSPRKIWIAFSLFQSTPPRGRRLTQIMSSMLSLIFQSTPPRGRRLQGLRTCGAIPHISIHASAREATSNHIIINLPTIYFNPRLREGGDKGEYASDFTEVISIHASAREATALITKIHLKHHISFQHTVHKSPFNVNYPFQ